MEMSNADETCEIDGIPVSPLLSEQGNRYGSVPGLPDEELADPWELERAVMLEEWGPVLALPVRHRKRPIRPNIDENWGLDWGAFATVDFERTTGGFDKARYKADKLKEELRDTIMMMSVVSGRLPRAKRQVLKLLRTGVIDLEHIESLDMYQMARYYLRALRLHREIRQLKDVSWAKLRKELAEVLG